MNSAQLKKYYSSREFIDKYIYEGNDLGITYSKDKTIFKLWAPTADNIVLRLYATGDENDSIIINSYSMIKSDNGVWVIEIKGDLNNYYYDYEVNVNSSVNITADPYAIACGVNGNRSMVLDLESTNPKGWNNDTFGIVNTKCPIIYELHIKDFSHDKACGIKEEFRGKYLAFTQKNTTLNNDKIHVTGIDYLKSLGITHVHLLPCFDYASVDESIKDNSQFNWGYDPLNYNVPEGSYSTNPYNGAIRIKEFKEMVLSLHNAGIRVVMDVVYNHTYSLDSWFQKTVPYYFYRENVDGSLCNGSACGNDTASEREMFGKYIKESVLYWTQEYHIDGFRFDLMGLHNVELMNEIRKELDKLPNGRNILMYGEPWAADESCMENNAVPALKKNIAELEENISIFCDNTRDSIKGHVFYGEVPGFVNGGKGFEKQIKSSTMAWCDNSEDWCPKSPSQIISYISAHDNFTLYDKLIETMRIDKDYINRDDELIDINKLAAVILFTCQGTVFFQAGEEFARTKYGEENSYNLSPELNMINWNRLYEYNDLVEYYKGLIKLRSRFSSFYNKDIENIKRYNFINEEDGLVTYTLTNSNKNIDSWDKIYVAFNSTNVMKKLEIPQGKWQVLVNKESSKLFLEEVYIENIISVSPNSAIILGKK